jgi:hypothetical protein
MTGCLVMAVTGLKDRMIAAGRWAAPGMAERPGPASRRGLNLAGRRGVQGHSGEMAGNFGGEVAAFYARYRRGYPPAFVDAPASSRTAASAMARGAATACWTVGARPAVFPLKPKSVHNGEG